MPLKNQNFHKWRRPVVDGKSHTLQGMAQSPAILLRNISPSAWEEYKRSLASDDSSEDDVDKLEVDPLFVPGTDISDIEDRVNNFKRFHKNFKKLRDEQINQNQTREEINNSVDKTDAISS